MGAALRTAVRGVLGSLVSHCLLNELHCLCVMGVGARTPVQTSVILCKALALCLWTFIKHGLYQFPISAHLVNDFRVTFSVWGVHSKEWNLPSGETYYCLSQEELIQLCRFIHTAPPLRKMGSPKALLQRWEE